MSRTWADLTSELDAARAADEAADDAWCEAESGTSEEAAADAACEAAATLFAAAEKALAEYDGPRPWILLDLDSGPSGGWVSKRLSPCSLEEARAQARAWAQIGEADTSEGPVWADIAIVDPLWPGSGDWAEYSEEVVTTQVEEDEPECTRPAHAWHSPHEIVGGCESNPGVWASGGGVAIHEVCRHCGCARITDTWAQRPDTGEQGLRSVTYREEA